MRAALERLARRWWAGSLGSGGRALHVLAAPLSRAWARASAGRALRRAGHGARFEGLRVISVGNLAVGGTGKTPVAAWVAQRLAAAGVPTHLLAGLHGADEALLHARWSPSVPVLVDRNRARAAARAHAEGARAVVLDDGFQHFAVARDLDIVLLAAEDRFPGPVLPRGPYRERPEALARADAVVVTRRTATCEAALALAERARRLAPEALSAGLRLAPGGLQPLSVWAEPARADADGAELRRVAAPALAVCALGRPDAFGEAVAEQVGGPVELMAFADHHAYTLVEVDRVSALAEGRPIVVSAKDAVKLAPYAARLGAAWVLTEELCWDWGEETLARRIDALMAEAVGP